jgi:hypothetical protein
MSKPLVSPAPIPVKSTVTHILGVISGASEAAESTFG